MYFNSLPPSPKIASPPAPIAASVASKLASSPGVLSCSPAAYSIPSSTPLPVAAPRPVPAEILPISPIVLVF